MTNTGATTGACGPEPEVTRLLKLIRPWPDAQVVRNENAKISLSPCFIATPILPDSDYDERGILCSNPQRRQELWAALGEIYIPLIRFAQFTHLSYFLSTAETCGRRSRVLICWIAPPSPEVLRRPSRWRF